MLDSRVQLLSHTICSDFSSSVSRGTSEEFLSTDPAVTAWGTTVTLKNESSQVYLSTVTTVSQVQFSLVIIIALVGLAGNAVVFWLLGFRMQKNIFSIYILNLAGADFLFLFIQTTYAIEGLIRSNLTTPPSIPDCFITVLTCTYLTGMSILGAISTERCLSVLFPIWHRCRRPRSMSAVVCSLLWALSLLLSMLEGKYCGFLFWDKDKFWCQAIKLTMAACQTFLCVLLFGSSLALLARLLCGSQRMQLTRLYVTMGITVLIFLLCGLPWGIHWFLIYCIKYEFVKPPVRLYYIEKILSTINSCANPIIYFFVGSIRQQRRRRKQPQTLRLILQRALDDSPEVDRSEGSLPQEALEMWGSA